MRFLSSTFVPFSLVAAGAPVVLPHSVSSVSLPWVTHTPCPSALSACKSAGLGSGSSRLCSARRLLAHGCSLFSHLAVFFVLQRSLGCSVSYAAFLLLSLSSCLGGVPHHCFSSSSLSFLVSRAILSVTWHSLLGCWLQVIRCSFRSSCSIVFALPLLQPLLFPRIFRNASLAVSVLLDILSGGPGRLLVAWRHGTRVLAVVFRVLTR